MEIFLILCSGNIQHNTKPKMRKVELSQPENQTRSCLMLKQLDLHFKQPTHPELYLNNSHSFSILCGQKVGCKY